MIDWKTAAETEVEEQSGFDDLPAGAWCAGATATTANGGASPTMKKKHFNDDDRGRVEYYAFNVGLLVKGGDKVLDPVKHKDRYMFFSSSVHPREDDDGNVKGLLHGKLVGFINAVYATGLALDLKDKKERAKLRWHATLAKLAEVEKAHPEINEASAINEITGQPDTALAIMQLAIAGIEDDSRMILFKTGMSKKRAGFEPRVEVKQFEDCVPANLVERKVVLFDAIGVVTPAASVPAF